MTRSCVTCKFSLWIDVGYSNYTVEGTDFACGLNMHPDGRFDRWYKENDLFKFGETCDSYRQGNPISIDVDSTAIESLSSEQTKIWAVYQDDESDSNIPLYRMLLLHQIE